MNNFAEYLTPEEMAELDTDPKVTAEVYHRQVKKWKGKKCQCGESAWILSDTGLCFSCVTGEHDASEDFELVS